MLKRKKDVWTVMCCGGSPSKLPRPAASAFFENILERKCLVSIPETLRVGPQWLDSESPLLREMSQSQKDKYDMFALI